MQLWVAARLSPHACHREYTSQSDVTVRRHPRMPIGNLKHKQVTINRITSKLMVPLRS